MVSNPPGDQNDANAAQYVQGACSDYAACVGTTGSDYWWAGATQNQTGTTVPCDGVFRLDNNWSSPQVGASYVGGFRLLEITDGLSNTIMVGEKHVPRGKFGDFASNDGAAYNGDHGTSFRGASASLTLARKQTDTATNRFGSYHDGICQFVFCDGSVHAISISIDGTTLGRLASRNDGQPIDMSKY
jgi:hypothetical protein